MAVLAVVSAVVVSLVVLLALFVLYCQNFTLLFSK